MEHNIYGQFLGYYFNLSAFLSQHPKGVPGDCFINGETLSLWVWDTMNRKWIDSNRPDNWLKGIIDNPLSFIPDVKPGVKTAYLYIAPEAAKVTFSFFKNGETAISVQTKSSAIISLFWNGDYWESAVTEIDTDLSALARKDLSNIEETTFKSKNILKTIYLKYDFSTDGLLSNLAPNDSDNGTITSILNENINGNCVLYAMDNHNCVSPCHVLSDSAKSEFTLTLICADNKIHTVTLNSSIDKAYQLACPLVDGTVMRVETCIDNAGGKGLNAARAVATCGEKIVATGFVGGNNGRLLCELLDADGIEHDFVHVAAETRCCVNVLEPNGRSTEFLEPGRAVTEDEVAAVREKVGEIAARADVVTFNGSVPAGCGDAIYRELVEIVRAAEEDAGRILAEGERRAEQADADAERALLSAREETVAAAECTAGQKYAAILAEGKRAADALRASCSEKIPAAAQSAVQKVFGA